MNRIAPPPEVLGHDSCSALACLSRSPDERCIASDSTRRCDRPHPAHLNRTLKTLRAEGRIERLVGGLVVVADLVALKSAGSFDVRYLHPTK